MCVLYETKTPWPENVLLFSLSSAAVRGGSSRVCPSHPQHGTSHGCQRHCGGFDLDGITAAKRTNLPTLSPAAVRHIRESSGLTLRLILFFFLLSIH